MKQFTSFFATAIFIVGAMLLGGCKGDPGPQGPPGVGSDVFEGFAEGIKCASCHNPDIDTTYFIAGRAYQWAQSKHANGGDIERNGPSCAGCHTTEGFMQRMNGQTVTAQLVPVRRDASRHSRRDVSRSGRPRRYRSFPTSRASNADFDFGKAISACSAIKPGQ